MLLSLSHFMKSELAMSHFAGIQTTVRMVSRQGCEDANLSSHSRIDYGIGMSDRSLSLPYSSGLSSVKEISANT